MHQPSNHCCSDPASADSDNRLTWFEKAPVILCGLALLLGFVVSWVGYEALALGLFLTSVAAGGLPTSLSTYHSLKNRELNVDLLMLMGAVGAAIAGDVYEAAILLFLFSLAELLESYAMGRTRSALRSLMELRPDEATVERDGTEATVPLDQVEVGEIILVRPGERIPLDGTLITGSADVDESALTGESLPVFKEPDSTLLAGSINLSGALRIRTLRPAGESTLARIVQLVEQARGSRAHTQRILDQYVVFYVAVILAGAAIAALVPPLMWGSAWKPALYRAMTLLVVASPCALVISTPATILSAIAAAARRGILFKGGASVEALAKATAIAFDKTGTLTDGKLAVTHVSSFSADHTEADILTLAAAAESSSEHPLAKAIVHHARQQGLTLPPAEDFHTTAGLGVAANVSGSPVMVGSLRFLQTAGLSVESPPGNSTLPASATPGESGITTIPWQQPALSTGTQQGKIIYVAAAGQLVGQVVLADQLRDEAAAAVKHLKQLGIQEIVMLTGDQSHEAETMAKGAGVDTFHAGLLPEEKVTRLKELSDAGLHVVMVGDGVNDAPALATADVGVAMGAAGTDLAIESADVVLMSSHLGQLVEAVSLSSRAEWILKQNLLFASAVVVFLVTATLLDRMPISLGVLGHEGSTILVVLNGLRLLVSRRTKLE